LPGAIFWLGGLGKGGGIGLTGERVNVCAVIGKNGCEDESITYSKGGGLVTRAKRLRKLADRVDVPL